MDKTIYEGSGPGLYSLGGFYHFILEIGGKLLKREIDPNEHIVMGYGLGEVKLKWSKAGDRVKVEVSGEEIPTNRIEKLITEEAKKRSDKLSSIS